MEKKSIRLGNGETYFYIEYGNGPKVLILIHGNLSSCVFYKPILKDFEGYRVIALDMRGFGDSTYNTPIDTMEDLSDDLHLFMQRMNIEKASLMGWSAGGPVVLKFAAKYPDMVEKLILKSAASYRGYPIYVKDDQKQPIFGKFYQTKSEMAKDPVNITPVYFMLQNKDTVNMKIVYDFAIYNIKKPKQRDYDLQMEEVVKQRNIIDFDWALTSFNMSNFTNGVTLGEDTIKDVVCPVIALWGEHDMTVLEYMVDENIEAIKNIKKVVFKNAGHSIMTDQHKEFVDVVNEFLKE